MDQGAQFSFFLCSREYPGWAAGGKETKQKKREDKRKKRRDEPLDDFSACLHFWV